MRDARADITYAVRLFARQPAILLLTIVGLSMGLGVATSAFSIVNAARLRGDGLVDSDRAPAILKATGRGVWTAWKYDEFLRLREGSTRMQVEALLTDAARVGTTAGETEAPPAVVAFVSGGFFAAAGGGVVTGRALRVLDEAHTGPPPVVISFACWNSTFNRDPGVVGRTIRIGRTEATIVGVAARGFAVPRSPLLWIPLTAFGSVFDAPSDGHRQGPGVQGARTRELGVEVFGRLLPGVTFSEAEGQLGGVAATLPRPAAAGNATLRVKLDPHAGLGRVSLSEGRAITAMVSAVIVLVLLLACANVASVLIATAITREREIGVRTALGASRWRIVRQLVTESLLLGAIAAPLGLALSYATLPLIGRMIGAPPGVDLAPDANVYLFLGIVSLVTGVAAGLAPAWHGRGADLVTPLKGAGGRQNRIAPRRFRSLLVMTQAAVSVLLIVMATLFVRATFRSAAIDVGFDAQGLYTMSTSLGRDAFEDGGSGIRAFYERAVPELRTVPGVVSVTLAELTPFGGATKTAITRETPARVVHFNRTRAGYFETVGLRLLAGRTYTQDEVAAQAPVAVVSHSLAQVYWRGQSPLGHMLPPEIPVAAERPVVIGVVADAVTARLHERNSLAFYEPLGPQSERFAQLVLRVAPGADDAIPLASQRLRAADPRADVRITSVAARLKEATDQPRTLATLAGVVGVIAIVLCVIGLYGLTASVVGQRTREMGVRVAMGAEPRDLIRLLMRDSLRPVVLGLVIGVVAALLASRVVASFLFGVSPRDPVAFAGAAAILLVAAWVAVLVPTRRAAAVDPAFVLRQS